jgi:hypothetical protein
MSYTQLLYHIVIRTKYSKKSIPSQHAEQLYKYITGYIKKKIRSLSNQWYRKPYSHSGKPSLINLSCRFRKRS